jgi:hypothetical protein
MLNKWIKTLCFFVLSVLMFLNTAQGMGYLAGEAQKAGESQPSPEGITTLSATITAVPGHPGYEDEPYTLFADGVVIQEGLTDEDGVFTFDLVPGIQVYTVELVNGHRFEIEPKEGPGEASSYDQYLARQGYRDYHGQAGQLEPLASPDAYRSAAFASSAKGRSLMEQLRRLIQDCRAFALAFVVVQREAFQPGSRSAIPKPGQPQPDATAPHQTHWSPTPP